MTWEEKFAAIQAIADGACLRMRCPGDWYVSAPGVEIKIGNGLLSGDTGDGVTPETAVEDHWLKWAAGQTLVRHAYRDDRALYRWNGYMWSQITEP